MNILFVHNNYQQAGGEDAVVNSEVGLMTRRGHSVDLVTQDNRIILSLLSKVKVFLDVAYSVKYKKWLSEQIRRVNPDVVHVHNFFPLLSPSIYDACQEFNVPVVQTLHNYRTICSSALLMRDGILCDDCINSSPYHAVLHRCYKNSFSGSFAVARMIDKHRKQGTWNHKVNRFIALSEFSKGMFIEAGLPKDKIKVKANFVTDFNYKDSHDYIKRKNALFVGRLSTEKGVTTLMRAWDKLDLPLTIVGSGPLSKDVEEYIRAGVVAIGAINQESVRKEMSKAAFLVMPSECYEGFPMVLAEAFMQGLPVVVSRLGSMAEIVDHGITGLHFEAGNSDDLAEKVQWMIEHPTECGQMGINARKVYEEKYTPERNYEMLMGIYCQAIDDARKSN